MHIRNPVEWSVDQVRAVGAALGSTAADWQRVETQQYAQYPAVARIGLSDLRDALAKGFADFLANRTDVILLCVFYPVVGLLLGRIASGEGTMHLLFPLVAGFALIGPLAAVGLYEMSRRRELGKGGGWSDAFAVLRSPSLGPLILLGIMLAVIFVAWLVAADEIYLRTLGQGHTTTIGAFVGAVLGTGAGHAMIVLGVGVGFLFAALVLTLSVVSFPMLIDRNVGVEVALTTSIRAVAANPATMAAWGLIVAAALVLGSIPLFVGLVVVIPVLGHATWHLYRKLVPR
jgi:uncharacterized membrane protein